MTPQELKNSILQLAIQGKLVEQRPEEGTAEELYRQIQEEKKRLIKEGKIKKEKPLPEIAEDEMPFEIPEGWMWIRVGNCGSWGSGATPSRINSEYYGGAIPWLKTGDLNDGVVIKIPEYITELALEKTSVRLNPVGSVLMAMYGVTIGKLGILGVEATTNQACCACIPYNGIYNKYLFYFLMASRTAFIKMGEGGAQPNISKEKIVNALFSLPPLAEQKRIVAKIEELLPYIDRYEQAWNRLEDFNKRFPVDMQKSLLQWAIQGKLVEQRPEEGTAEELYRKIQEEKRRLVKEGKIKKEKPLPEISEDEVPFEIPGSWKWVRLGSVIDILSGFAFKSTDFKQTGKYRLLRGINLSVGNIRWDDTVYVDAIPKKLNVYQIHRGDVLIGLDRPWISDGIRVAIFDEDEDTYLVQRVLRIRETSAITKDYVTLLLRSNLFRNSVEGETTGISVPHISPGQVCAVAIPLPPLAEQKRIVAKLEELLPLCERLK